MTSKVPVTIITGFLGAGKTTLIRHCLDNAQGRRLALIINEFGDLGVDGEMLRASGADTCPEDRIVELTNGFVYSRVDDNFTPALEKLLSLPERPDHILIETSGLALPKPLLKAFDNPDIRNRATIDGVIAVVDAPGVASGRFTKDVEELADHKNEAVLTDHDNPLEDIFEDQLLAADVVILSKVDLLGQFDPREVEAKINRAMRRPIKIVSAQQCAVPLDVVLGLNAKAEDDLAARLSHLDGETQADREGFESFVIKYGILDTSLAIVRRGTKAANEHGILRIKGFAAIHGKPMRLVAQGVGSRIETRYDREWRMDEVPTGYVVVIGPKGMNKDVISQMIIGENR